MKKNKSSKQFVNAILVIAGLTSSLAQATVPIYTNQGLKWTNLARQQYYVQDQGSRIIPLKWIQALKQSNGQPFMAGSLSRYGYLPNPKTPGIPIGFSVAMEKKW